VPGQVSAENTAVYEESTTKSKDHGDSSKESNPPATPTGTEPPADKAEKGTRARKASRALEPFDQSEREEMEHLLEELRGHLGMKTSLRAILDDAYITYSPIPYALLGRRRHRQQLLVQR
jgi:hypothetical protein